MIAVLATVLAVALSGCSSSGESGSGSTTTTTAPSANASELSDAIRTNGGSDFLSTQEADCIGSSAGDSFSEDDIESLRDDDAPYSDVSPRAYTALLAALDECAQVGRLAEFIVDDFEYFTGLTSEDDERTCVLDGVEADNATGDLFDSYFTDENADDPVLAVIDECVPVEQVAQSAVDQAGLTLTEEQSTCYAEGIASLGTTREVVELLVDASDTTSPTNADSTAALTQVAEACFGDSGMAGA